MNMDKPLRRVAIFALVLIVALMAQVNYIQGTQAEKLQSADLNNRQYLDVFKRPRGKIIAGSETLVFSKQPPDSENYGRHYKDGPVFAPVTGFYNGNTNGLERAYHSLLDGRDKRITNQRWFDQFIGKKAVGADVETTIDPKAQRAAYQALKNGTNRRAGAAVIDLRTGAIKVLASYPSFDPNEVAPQRGIKGGQRLQQLENQKGVIKPLVDNALSQTFPPGSSYKTVVAALMMQNEGLNGDSVVQTGPFNLPESGRPLPNSHDTGNCSGQAPLLGAFAESCNTTFARAAVEMGIQKLHDGSAEFGFGKPIEVEPDLEAPASDVPVKDPVTGNPTGGDDVGRSGIGQANVRATPLQMAMVAAAVANNGRIMKPYLVQRVRAADQEVLYEADPREFARPLEEDTADQLKAMMAAVVSQGTAKNLQGMNIAGKTGTAETGDPAHNSRWFVGYSPIEKPRYAFAIVTEGPGSAASSAGPISGTIMQAVLSR
ncbi:penicillin-binding transpeptidase domain-containing protein [Thermomonospora umbrina]|uniref:Cell elongation-specific peptidoglycan D,D-transpeptidase n=1 Tax=Thermomonospora umbrina TaxID=111806 RepID=A0A3D9SN46_9ACTN|nr:penicillin-binding transpeptidase domain-containing protein [Thermomonospora umbrina]REE97362.1 cell elongation-specific peptidoglycan D,D-transpeptidase [Thermomonospora umbrina]